MKVAQSIRAKLEAAFQPQHLVVEDESVFARAVAASLHRAGHSATIAGTLAQARAFLSSATSDPPDIVLLDMRLPDGDGFDLLPLLSESESAPTVVVSNVDDPKLSLPGAGVKVQSNLKFPVGTVRVLV